MTRLVTLIDGNVQVGTSLINCVDTSVQYTVFSENTFSENGVSITQILIAFLMLISVVTLPFSSSLFSVVPITFFKFSDFDLYSEIK